MTKENVGIVVYSLDAKGVFRKETGAEMLRIPLPKDGEARCIIETVDGKKWPFDTIDAMRKCLEHQAKLPQTFTLSEVEWLLDWVLSSDTDAYRKKLEPTRARGDRARSDQLSDWMNGVVP